jgi:hypothetical protein
MVGFLFVLLGVLVILGSAYVIISYASGMMTAIVDFVTTNDFSKLQQCGVTPPAQFNVLKNDLTTLVLPSLYIGLPLLLIILSVLMFLAGFYYHKGRHEDELKKVEALERATVHKLVKKMQSEKSSKKGVAQFEEESKEDSMIEEELEKESEETPQKTKKKKK